MSRGGSAAALIVALLGLSAPAASATVHLRPVAASPPIGLLDVAGTPTVTFRPQGRLPPGSYYYAVAVLVRYRRDRGGAPRPNCAISSNMGLTQYGRPRPGRRLELTLLPAPGGSGRWCEGGRYEGAVYVVPHPPPCSAYYPCYGRGSCGGLVGVCGVIPVPTPYSYPGGLPKPIDASARIVGRFTLGYGYSPGPLSGIEPPVAAALLATAKQEALRNGDAHPFDIEAVSTTMAGVAQLQSAGAGPSFATIPVYYVALRGRFVCQACSTPPGAPAPRGSVMTLTLSQPDLGRSGFGLASAYPVLSLVGNAVRLG